MAEEGGPQLSFPDVPKLELDQLIDQLIERAEGVRRAQGRLRALLRAIESVAGDLSVEQVLHRIVDGARGLVGSQYAALGVIGSDHGLEQFIQAGVDEQTAQRIGRQPQGKGLLGALINDPRPIRLRNVADDDRFGSFPAHHPEMQSFLGVPIHVRGEVFGNLYLANSFKGEFSAEDEELVLALASAAGTAISNARLYQEAQLRQRWLEASAEVHAQMFSVTGEDPLRSVARRSVQLADADLVTVGLLADDRKTFVVEFAFGRGADELVARRFDLATTLTGQVIKTAQPVLANDARDLDFQPVTQQVLETGPIIALPLQGTGEPRGVLMLARQRGRRPFTDTELSMAAGFATHASVALELAEAREAEQKMIMLQDRERIARDLHDHVIQELFAIGLGLEGIATQLGGEDQLAERLRRRVDDLDRAIRRIRTSIFSLRGLPGAPRQSLRHAVLEVASSVTPLLGFPPDVTFAGLLDVGVSDELGEEVVACIRELLTNVAKHARASAVSVEVALAGDILTVTVTDNGIGFPNRPRHASGIANLQARAELHGGTFEIARSPDGGSTATWKVEVT